MKSSYRFILLSLAVFLSVVTVQLYSPFHLLSYSRSAFISVDLDEEVPKPPESKEQGDITDVPCGDDRDWLQKQQTRRITLEKACAHYVPDRVTNDVLNHILVSDAYKTLYCFIPKVACSNWKKAILLLNGRHFTDIHHAFIRRLKNFSPNAVEKRLRDYTKFMIVRNPHERLLSAYNEKFAHKTSFSLRLQRKFGPIIRRNNLKYMRRKYSNSTATVEQRPRLDKDESTKVSFQEFIRYVGDPANKLTNGLLAEGHWREMYRLCSPCSIQYDFIAKLETITEDAPNILSHIGAKNLTSIVLAQSNHATNSSSESKIQKAYKQVTEEDVLQFEKRFEKDMALFGYERPTSITGFKSKEDDREGAMRQLDEI